ncbi:MAG: hypothetical protein KGI27_15490, partial [Thaumarchaeota archaeon]|nr:hypothetical protein [Nitrososphaerota archaeon]
IATTNKQNLVLGDTNTGNVTLNALNGGAGSVITLNSQTLNSNATTVNLGNGSASTIQTSGNQNLTLSAGTGTLNLNTVNNGPVTLGTGL